MSPTTNRGGAGINAPEADPPRDPRAPEHRAPERISALTRALLEAQETGGFVEPPSLTRSLTLDDAYRIGAEAARHRLRQGWSFGGWKVGFTNREIWSRWGLDRPIVAPVYRETIFHAARRAPAHVPLGTRAAPRIEVEVVFGFGCAAGSAATISPRADHAAASPGSPDWVALGAELVDCHYEEWRLHPADAVADFGLHAGLVVGPSVPMTGNEAWRSNPADSLRRIAVSLSGNGKRLAEGTGKAVLGSPLNVLAALGGSGADRGSLARRMTGYGFPAPPTQAPHPRYLVSTGTLTPLVEAQLGTRYEVASDSLPSFSFELV